MFVLFLQQIIARRRIVLLMCPQALLYVLLGVSKLIFYFAHNQHI
jgi:hypothetical protein